MTSERPPREIIARMLYAKLEQFYDPEGCGMLDLASADADSILSALKEAGWVCVPVEPTEEMIEAGMKHEETDLASEYRAMVAASQDQGRE